MAQNNTKAAIVIGDEYIYDPAEMQDCDIYYYPENITEWELADEAEHLKEFYAALVWPIWCPQHIRLRKVREWVEKQVLDCEQADREIGLPQCNIFCNFYNKGGCLYVNKQMD